MSSSSASSEPTGTSGWSRGTPEPAVDLARLQRRLARHVRLLAFLYQLERELGSAADIEEGMARTVALAQRTTGATSGGIALLGERRQVKVVISSGEGGPGGPSSQTVRWVLGRTLASWAAQGWEGLLVPDTWRDRHWSIALGIVGDVRSVVAAPLEYAGQFQGMLALTHHDPDHFTQFHLDMLRAAASRLSDALAKVRRYRSVIYDRTRLENIVLNLTDALFALDASGTVILTNPTMERLVGRSASELLGRHFREVIPLEHRSLRYPIEQVLHGGYASFDMDMTLRNAAGEEIPVRVGCGAIPGDRSRPDGAVVVLRDIRYLKEIEGLREDLTHMLVHDLKGPLASIGSTVQLLLQYPPAKIGEETLQELLCIADKSVRRLSRMIEAVLDVQRLEAGQFPLRVSNVDLRQLVTRVMNGVSPLVAEAGVKTRMDLAGDLPAVPGDKDVLLRVLWNLLDNALKYTPRGGLISVTAETLVLPRDAGRRRIPGDLPAGRWVQIDVTDSGVGIPAEEQERIFGKFAQGRRGPLRRRGVGLGLAFCRLAVEAHGGRIWVESSRGQGSTFSLVLPVFGPA